MRRWERRLASAIFLLAVTAASLVAFGVVADDDDADAGPGEGTLTITEVNHGRFVTVSRGDRVFLRLQGSPGAPWRRPSTAGDALGLVRSQEALDGSVSATFVALDVTPGVQVTAEREGGSGRDTRFQVTVRVVG